MAAKKDRPPARKPARKAPPKKPQAPPPPPRNRTGRPPYTPTKELRDTVSALRANGTTVADIAAICSITEDTLRKHFSRELEHGLTFLRAQIGLSFTRRALAGDQYAAFKWLQIFGGPQWKEVKRSELTGPGGKPIEIAGHLDAAQLSTAIDAIRAELASRGVGAGSDAASGTEGAYLDTATGTADRRP